MSAPANPLCAACRFSPAAVCEECGKQFCDVHGGQCEICYGDFCEIHLINDSSCEGCLDIYMERRSERFAEQERLRAERIDRLTEEIWSQYQAKKEPQVGEILENKAFKLNSSFEEINAMVEKERDKGGGLLRKRPEEKVEYTRLIHFPYIYFEYQYLKKRGFLGSKVPHRTSTVLSFFEPAEGHWHPDLNKEIENNNLVELKEGYFIPMEKERAEQLVSHSISIAINSPTEASIWRKNLNLDSSLTDFQFLSRVKIIYMPFWVTQFSTINTKRYLVYDRNGKKYKAMIEKINKDHLFATDIEKYLVEL